MRYALLIVAACTLPALAQEPPAVRTIHVYRYPDGRIAQVVIEEGQPPAVKASPLCRKCGEKCSCGAGCTCDAASYDGRCAAAPKIQAVAPPAPAIIPPAYYYPAPTYYAPPVYRSTMPAVRFGAQVGPIGFGAGAGYCPPSG
jgi:hypothetical protein